MQGSIFPTNKFKTLFLTTAPVSGYTASCINAQGQFAWVPPTVLNILPTRVVSSGITTPLTSDYVVEFQIPSGGSGQVSLPSAYANGTTFILKDGTGMATAFPIVVSGLPNIDNSSSFNLDQNWQSITVQKTAGGWRIL